MDSPESDTDGLKFDESTNSYLQELFNLKGEEVQKLSVVESIPQLLQVDSNATITRIIPKIQKELMNSTSEFHIVTSQMYLLLFQMKVPVNVITPVLQGIESRDSIVSNAWMETLLTILPELPEEIVKTEVLKSALTRCQTTRSTYSRVTSCKLLGQISVHPQISAVQVQREIIPVVHSLCQDCLFEVRASICRELPYIATGIAKLGEPINLMPLLVELSNDENVSVRAAAIDGLVLMVPLLTSNTVKTTIIPLFKQLCSKSTSHDDITYFAIAKVYGKLIETLLGNLSLDDAVWFMDFYKHLCLTGSSDDLDADIILGTSCRAYCANDLPVMTVLMKRLLPHELSYWYKIFSDLANDRNSNVRKIVAQHFDSITDILGNKNKLLKLDFINLLKDECDDVLQTFVPSIATILRHFAESELISREVNSQAALEIGRALIKCHTTVAKTNHYRLKVDFLKQLERLPFYFSSEFIHQHFTGLLLIVAANGKARPIRIQAARTLLVILRYNTNEIHRRWIRETLLNELARAKSCYTRIVFVKMCEEAMTVFSGKYFKEHFFTPLMAMTDDPVCNIRLCVVNLLPKLKRILVLPVDRPLQIKLETAISKLEITEVDSDILFSLKAALKQMSSMQVFRTQDFLIEDKRKADEEDSIQKGRFVEIKPVQYLQSAGPIKARPSPSAHTARGYSKGKKDSQPLTSNSSSNVNNNENMSFLDKHFYIDAGVALPDRNVMNPTDVDSLIDKGACQTLLTNQKAASKVTSDTFVAPDMVISVENTDIDNLSDIDLNKLKITTNITDDVKVNLQKINKTKDLALDVVKRNKRASCVFNSERKSVVKNVDLKRRSLNISTSDTSKIPVSFKKSTMSKNKSESTSSLNTPLSKIPSVKRKSLLVNDLSNNVTNNNKATDTISTEKCESKATQNISNKGSNLPVLIRYPK